MTGVAFAAAGLLGLVPVAAPALDAGVAFTPGSANVVSVRILERESPRHLEARGPHGAVRVDARAGGVDVDGEARASWRGSPGSWTLIADDGSSRDYDGALVVREEHGHLAVVLLAPLESYVARVVASESTASTPRAALEALAIVARS
ncbi:MAG TPA: SpoIID/LytB domain-containing protein, partial [bacterium]|nr:SpoIID/LytB domain-containing protein [bacterium]